MMQRRGFLASPLAALPAAAVEAAETRVYGTGDGIPHTPEEYARLLGQLAKNEGIAPDSYSLGGTVEKLEAKMAQVLGKEAAVWLPTGTLANHLGVRLLAGNKRRVLAQAESHLFKDCGDCAQTLSGLHMAPLAPGKATFTMKDIEGAAADAQTGRVLTPIGALQIETPVRRRRGERFDFEEMKRVAAWARAEKVGLHLDGARLFLESGYTGRPVKEYTALFDTVYVSTYKYFNAASGAVLAGPKALLDGLYHTRRMFGGGLPHAWPFAAISLHYVEGFERRFASAVKTSETVIQALQRDSNFTVERIENGTNIFRMRAFNVNAPVYQTRAAYAGLTLADPAGDWFQVQVNETWNRATAAEIVQRFVKGLG